MRGMVFEALAARLLAGSALAGLAMLGGCNSGEASKTVASGGAVANPCPTVTTLNPALPSDGGPSQAAIDCFAWQSFVALNWRADPARPGYPDPKATAADFGNPADGTPKVWETYLGAGAVFSGPVLQGLWQAKRPAVKRLDRISKFGAIDLSDITQAGSGHHWLTSQRGQVTYYEVMMNRDEYEFITQKDFDLTTYAGQAKCVTQKGKVVSDGPPVKPPPTGPLRGGLVMPEGSSPGWQDTTCSGDTAQFGDGVGAMEVKASWTPLPADHSLDYRYKTAVAQIVDPTTKSVRTVTVGLVGLHIIRKRFPRHQWTWSTFEQIDNSPDEGGPNGWTAPVLPPNANQRPRPAFTFFNPACNPNGNVYRCVHNAPPVPCTPGAPKCTPYNAPMQITRMRPVPAQANAVTAWYWSLLPKASVYNYYRLIDVQWPTRPGNPPPPGQRVPLSMGTPNPIGNAGGRSQIVANTTLESFEQSSNSCMDCHAKFASIATPPNAATRRDGLRRVGQAIAGGQAPYASDYSFIFASETVR